MKVIKSELDAECIKYMKQKLLCGNTMLSRKELTILIYRKYEKLLALSTIFSTVDGVLMRLQKANAIIRVKRGMYKITL